MDRPQLVIITGPTATGKTALAIELALRYGAEIISADSRQVYRYLDIGTAKPTPAQRAAVPHHALDLVNPDEQFDSARFRTHVLSIIPEIQQRGKRVMVVGGTGLYLRALMRGLFPGPPADAQLRSRLQTQEQTERKGFLHRWLRTVDPEAATRLHPNDTMRVVRALEVFLLTGTPLSHWQQAHGFRECSFSALTIGLICEREMLHRRIEARCQQMVEDGLLDEIRHVWGMGFGPGLPVFQTIGYAQMSGFLQQQWRYSEALTRMVTETKRLAKRQLTWLRAEPKVHWFMPQQERDIATVLDGFWQQANTESERAHRQY